MVVRRRRGLELVLGLVGGCRLPVWEAWHRRECGNLEDIDVKVWRVLKMREMKLMDRRVRVLQSCLPVDIGVACQLYY